MASVFKVSMLITGHCLLPILQCMAYYNNALEIKRRNMFKVSSFDVIPFEAISFEVTVKPVYKDHSRDPKIVAVDDRWSLFRGSFIIKKLEKGPQKSGRCWRMVTIRRWSLAQVWLYFIWRYFICSYYVRSCFPLHSFPPPLFYSLMKRKKITFETKKNINLFFVWKFIFLKMELF